MYGQKNKKLPKENMEHNMLSILKIYRMGGKRFK
jgi:hypothetical protein